MVIVERRCVDCGSLQKMYHNAQRCYGCAKKRRKYLDQVRYEKRKKSL